MDPCTYFPKKGNSHQDLAAKGVKITAVDYSSVASVQAALAGIDVLISTVGHDHLEVQDSLVLAAKAAGVKLFVPSEFGLPTDGPAGGVWGVKYELKQRLKDELHLPYAAFYTGLFPDYIFAR